MNKYVYFIPRGGINDNFTQIKHKINYCKKMNRILLLDMNYGSYNVNVHVLIVVMCSVASHTLSTSLTLSKTCISQIMIVSMKRG